jgi:hypothetical protein
MYRNKKNYFMSLFINNELKQVFSKFVKLFFFPVYFEWVIPETFYACFLFP